jgi:hypothetical protein
MLWRFGETVLLLAAIVAFVIFVEGGEWAGVVVFFAFFGLVKGVEVWSIVLEGFASRFAGPC